MPLLAKAKALFMSFLRKHMGINLGGVLLDVIPAKAAIHAKKSLIFKGFLLYSFLK